MKDDGADSVVKHEVVGDQSLQGTGESDVHHAVEQEAPFKLMLRAAKEGGHTSGAPKIAGRSRAKLDGTSPPFPH